MSHGNHHPKAAINRHTKRPPPAGERRSVNSAAKEATRRRSVTASVSTKTHRPTSHPRMKATTRADEPSWHQLLGTLLSSQRTDAHPPFTFFKAPGRRLGSNLPEFLARVSRLSAFLAFLNSTRASFSSSPPVHRAFPTFRNPTRLSGPLCPRHFASCTDHGSRSGATVGAPKRLQAVPGVRRPWDQPPR